MSDTKENHSIILNIDNKTKNEASLSKELENRQNALNEGNKMISESNERLKKEISILKMKMNALNNMCQEHKQYVDDDDILLLVNNKQNILQQTMDDLNSQNKSLLEENKTLKSKNKLLEKELSQRMKEIEELYELENEYNSVINDLENQLISLNNSLDIKTSKNDSKCSFNLVHGLNASKSVSSNMLKLKMHRDRIFDINNIENKNYSNKRIPATSLDLISIQQSEVTDDGDCKVMDIGDDEVMDIDDGDGINKRNELCPINKHQILEYEAKEWIYRKNTEEMEIQNKMLNEELNDIKEELDIERLEYQLKIRHLRILAIIGLIVMIAMIITIVLIPIIQTLLTEKFGNNKYFFSSNIGLDNNIDFYVLSVGILFVFIYATLICCVRYKTRLKQRFYSS